jgi:hypothetical protein
MAVNWKIPEKDERYIVPQGHILYSTNCEPETVESFARLIELKKMMVMHQKLPSLSH